MFVTSQVSMPAASGFIHVNNTKCFLQRNLSKCPLQVKSNCYKALIKPILEYAATAW